MPTVRHRLARGTVVSTTFLPATYLARSLYPEPFLASFSCDEGHRGLAPSAAVVGQLQPCRGEAAYGVRELVTAFSRATAVSAVPLPATYLARSLYAEPFLAGFSCDEGHRAGLPRPQPWSVSYNLAAAKPHMECGNLFPLSPVPLPFRQCLFLRRTLLVPFTQNHSSQASVVTKATVRACPVRSHGRSATTFAAAKPHMECGNLLPLSPVPLPSRQCLFLRAAPKHLPVRASPI